MGERAAGTRFRLGALLAVLALLAAAPAARAQGLGSFGLGGLPTNLLPANPANSARTIHPGFDRCPAGQASCPAEVILEMYERWRPLNASCDHRAVFALTYLRTTEAFARAVGSGLFEDVPWINHEDAVFADFYFRAFDARAAGAQVPVSWQIAFDAAASPDVTGIGDMFLGMNAHINRDLSYTLAAVGLVKPDGGTRKTEHDRVNQFLATVAEPLQAELGRRYDPLFTTTDTPTPLDEQTVLNAVYGFREQAWRNAEPYVNAGDEGSRATAAASIESQSQAYANSIRAANTVPGYGPTRDAYCRANLEPSFRVDVLDARLRPVIRRRTLRVGVYTDGPARVTLAAALQPRPKKPGSSAKAKEKRTKKKKRQRTFARPVRFETNRAGDHVVELRLTKRGRKALRKRRRSAHVDVLLEAPRGMSASDRGRLQRTKRSRRLR